EERLAQTLAAHGGADIEVFQPDAVAALEGRIGVEPERETDRLSVPFGNVAKHLWCIAKEITHDVRLGCLHFVQQLLVFSELAHKGHDERSVCGGGGADVEHGGRFKNLDSRFRGNDMVGRSVPK